MKKGKINNILSVAGYITNSVLALITISSAYGGMVNPSISSVPAILAMTFPFWLILTILALILSLFFSRLIAIIPAATLILCLGPILNLCPFNYPKEKLSSAEEARSFSFMSYNVYGLNDFRAPLPSPHDSTRLYKEAMAGESNPTLSFILKKNADIVCLQELWWNLKPNHRIISPALLDSVTSQYPYRVIGSGNGIFSKYPLYQIKLPKLDDQSAFHLAAIAEILGHRTLIISAHLQSIGLDNSDKELYHDLTEGEGDRQKLSNVKHQLLSKLSIAFRNRAKQANIIRQQIDSLNVENVIITGDFNDIQNCYAIRTLTKDDFKSAFAMAGHGPLITYHANRFYFQIDHTLYRGKLEAIDFKRYNFDRSDHYPIETRFIWSENAPTVNRHLKGIDLINR